MTVINVGRLEGLSPLNQITIDPTSVLTVEGPLRVSTIQNNAGLTILTSTSTGVVTINQNLNTSSTLTSNIVAPSRFIVPVWSVATRPTSPSIGTFGYNSQLLQLENFTGSTWATVTNILVT